jgi:hypothetical protein
MMKNASLEELALALMGRIPFGKSFTFRSGTNSVDEDRIEYDGYSIYWDKGVWFIVQFTELTGELKTLEFEFTDLIEWLFEDLAV